ncbi:MAG: N,N-dimethylformamidase beta subunit family domain-containing protein, partial [Pseudomonadota bacterium]
PSRGKAHGPVAFLASTATYLAYANDINAILMAPLIGGKDAVLPEEELLVAHPEFGRSLYHKHVDGFGIHFSSYLRPTVNIRPDSRAWSLTADLDIVHWLEKSDIDYEVITDEQLHHEGEELLANFSVLVTGAHPEYYSQAMRDGIDAFTHAGGRLMYMGGNGFYWKVAYSDAWPAAIELRRAEDGTRAWRSQAAEYYQQFDGELGGLWLRQELPPQKLVGVGFAAQGNPGGMRFRKGVAVHDPRIGFAFEGVETDIIADYGKMKASAMGEEVDRVDYSLGTPAHAIVLASSENHHASMLRCKEELFLILPQIVDQDSKADVVFFEVEGGGAVFSTGSIAWSSVLAFNHFDNPSAKLTMNVLRRFMDPALFYPPETENPIETLLPEVYQMPPGLRIDQFSYGRMLWESLRKALMLIALPIMLKAKNIAMPAPAPRRDTVLGDHKRG